MSASQAREESPFRRLAGDFMQSRMAAAGLVLMCLILLCAVIAPLISPQNPYDLAQIDIMDSSQPPGSQSADGLTFWLGDG